MSVDNRGIRAARIQAARLGVPIPKIENIHQTVYDAVTKYPERFDMSNWHGVVDWTKGQSGYNHCNTTHCRAGWVIALAGAAGRRLEHAVGAPEAAALIYKESDPSLKACPSFYVNNEQALRHMKLKAEQEAERNKLNALPPECPRRKKA